MRNLELNQMENLQGGDFDCALDSTVAILGVVGIGLALFSNPVGWIAGISAGVSILGGGASMASLVYNGNCF